MSSSRPDAGQNPASLISVGTSDFEYKSSYAQSPKRPYEALLPYPIELYGICGLSQCRSLPPIARRDVRTAFHHNMGPAFVAIVFLLHRYPFGNVIFLGTRSRRSDSSIMHGLLYPPPALKIDRSRALLRKPGVAHD